MKNLKKVLALVVALTMVLGTVAFAFTDVDVENDAYTAVQTLSSLEILNGYEDGTFGPEKDITRAEFAAVVCRALGLESSVNGAKGTTMFTDVPADHWATGYINLAAGQGIINGMGDGTFEPESNVTYEQAVKMLVVALGFEPLAAQKGGYPTGYLVVANTYGMTAGVKVANETSAANRGVVAQLTYNALDIPMMIQTGFGTNLDYKIQDGKNDQKYQTLLTGLDVAKLGGVITKTAIIGGTDANTVEFDVDDNFENDDWYEEDDKDTKVTDDLYIFNIAEGVYVNDYFGIASEIFVKEVRNDWEIIAIMPGADSEIIEIEVGDIDTKETTDSVIRYFEDANATKSKKLNLADDVKIYINNEDNSGKYTVTGDIIVLSDDAKVQVINNDTNTKYDIIIVKEYQYNIVKDVEADRDRFSAKIGSGRFSFDFEDENVVNTILNADGEAITLADFAEGDVFGWISEGGAKSDFDWIEIINYGQNAVTGAVTEVNSADDSIGIDGVTYELTSALSGTIKPNEEGTFYLTADNKVFHKDTTAATAKDYAYVLQVGDSSDAFSTGIEVKLLTVDGSIVTYKTRDDFKVNGTTISASMTNWNAEFGAIDNSDVQKDMAKRIVIYKLDSNDKIREIASAAAVEAKGEYAANSTTIGANTILEENTVIFDITSTDVDDATVSAISTLVDETEYKGYVAANSEGDVVVYAIYEGKGSIDLAQDFAIVDSTSDITVDGEDVVKVNYYTAADSELKSIILEDGESELIWDKGIADADKDLEKGDVIIFSADAKGYVNKYAIVAKADAKGISADVEAEYAKSEDYRVVFGYIGDIKNDSKTRIFWNKAGVAFDAANPGTPMVVSEDVYGYTYNDSASRIKINVDNWMGANSVDVPDVKAKEATFFVAKTTNGIATDIITYSTARTITIK